MNERCDVCPSGPPVEPGLYIGADEDNDRQRVLLVAGHDRLRRTSDWDDAVVALATAVVRAGGTVIIPDDLDVAPLVCLAAWPYAHPLRAERHEDGRNSSVLIVETGPPPRLARSFLGVYVHAGVASYRDLEFAIVPLEELPAIPLADLDTGFGAHGYEPDDVPIGRLIDRFQPTALVVVQPDDRVRSGLDGMLGTDAVSSIYVVEEDGGGFYETVRGRAGLFDTRDSALWSPIAGGAVTDDGDDPRSRQQVSVDPIPFGVVMEEFVDGLTSASN